MLPGAAEKGRQKGCGNFLQHKIYKTSVSSVEAGMVLEGQFMRSPDPIAGFNRAYF